MKELKNESRVDNTDREVERGIEEGWILLPDVQEYADCATMSDQMERYAGEKSRERAFCRYMGQKI